MISKGYMGIPKPQRFVNHDPAPGLPFQNDLEEPPTAWESVLVVCVIVAAVGIASVVFGAAT